MKKKTFYKIDVEFSFCFLHLDEETIFYFDNV